jgi:hypothetical protein
MICLRPLAVRGSEKAATGAATATTAAGWLRHRAGNSTLHSVMIITLCCVSEAAGAAAEAEAEAGLLQ